MMNIQRNKGIIIFYLGYIINMASNFILTPLLINRLGDSDYSIYKVMGAFIGPLAILNLGLATIVTKSISVCNVNSKESVGKKQNTIFLCIIISIVISFLIFIIGFILVQAVPRIYGSNYNQKQIILAQKMCYSIMATIAVGVISDVFRGCVLGNEKYTFYYGIQLLQYVLKFILVLLILRFNFGALELTLVDLFTSVFSLITLCIYVLYRLQERPRLSYIDKPEVLAIFSFSAAILIQAIINQVNNNLDIVILGAMAESKEVITMYSSALTIYTVYNSLIAVFSGAYLPQASKLVEEKATGEELSDFVIRPGRVQAIIALGVVFGFIVCGYNFIEIWIGEKYIDAYFIVIMLVIPVTIPLVENVCISILDAMLKRMFRSSVLLVMAFINILVSLLLIKIMGFWGAALGTVGSLVIGHIIIMNIYYERIIGLNVKRIFKDIFKGILPAAFLSFIVTLPLTVFLENNFVFLLIKMAGFCCVYTIFLVKFGLTKEEKSNLTALKNLMHG